jgi:hypothetical protein
MNPDNSKCVTLGGFGGSITLAFDHTVMDDACNPMGLDFIVFGNAAWVGGDPARRWAECATVEIALDANGNGEADDPWFLVPGSAPAGARREQAWDNNAGTPAPPMNVAWYPAAPAFPGWPAMYTTSAHELGASVAPPVVNGAGAGGAQGVWGYADATPTLLLGDMSGATGAEGHDNRLDQPEDRPGMAAEVFYTAPTGPAVVGIAPGSGGGDGFDIAWAIDAASGAPAGLPGFDFVRITTAIDVVLPGGLGEVSAEISGVADVRSRFAVAGDADGDGAVTFVDLNIVLSSFGAVGAMLAGDVTCDGRVDFVDLNVVLSNFGSAA